jgi:hypothetical protein
MFADALEEDQSNRSFDLGATLIRRASGVVDSYGAPASGQLDRCRRSSS